MKRILRYILVVSLACGIMPVFAQLPAGVVQIGHGRSVVKSNQESPHKSQSGPSQSKNKKKTKNPLATPAVVISSYFNDALEVNEWTEFLVYADNVNLTGWWYQDNNTTQTAWQGPAYKFVSNAGNNYLWRHLRAGTIIMVHSHTNGYANHIDKPGGYIEVTADDANYFTGGAGPAGVVLNIATPGDFLRLEDSLNVYVHGVGHMAPGGPAYTACPSPKLNLSSSLSNGSACIVSPGPDIDHYGNLPASNPQDGLMWTTTESGANLTFGLPNKGNLNNPTYPDSTNSVFWRTVRQPLWNSPTLTGAINMTGNKDTLKWNRAVDPCPWDGTMGYLVVRNRTNLFSRPLDGHTYALYDMIAAGTGDSIVCIKTSSQDTMWVDNTTIPCTNGLYYRVYAFRYSMDATTNLNDYNKARGRAYNETNYASFHAMPISPVAATSPAATPNTFCSGTPPASITLTAQGGSGATFSWYTGGCGTANGGILAGHGTGANNSLTIPPPASTTTYYGCWETNCFTSTCVTVTVTVNQDLPVSVAIAPSANPVCTGTSVTFTATPTNGGTTPAYQWKVNGGSVGANSPTYTYVPLNNDNVTVVLTSNATCATGSPATSNTVIMMVNPQLVVACNITPSQDPVCPGTSVTYTANATNGGTTPTYEWHVNGGPIVSTASTYSYIPLSGDVITCIVTSNVTCPQNPQATGTFTPTFATSVLLGVTITASEEPVCTGNPATYTANTANGGTNPTYDWHVNGGPSVGTNSTYTFTPVLGDVITCIVNSNAGCVSNNPQTGSFTPTFTSSVSLSVAIAASVDPVCQGSTATYTANATNGGSAPTYEWHVNGGPVAGTLQNYPYTPAVGDVITCIVNSNASCISNNPQTGTFTPTVTSSLTVSVTITAGEDPVCAGTAVTYTAHPVNGGTSPNIDWTRTGIPGNAGNGLTYTCTPNPGDVISCILSSNAGCVTIPTATADFSPQVLTAMQMTISILSSQNPVCEGSAATYTAHVQNGGSTPSYQWKVNGTVVPGTDSTYSYPPAPGDVIRCVVTASSTCTTNNPDSTTFTPVISPLKNAAVTVTANPPSACEGAEVTFTADTVNAGSAPTIDWMINGGIVQTGPSVVYKTSSLTGTEAVSCRLNSTASCLTANPVVSSPVTVPVSPAPHPDITNQPVLCAGSTYDLDAGTGYSTYLWQDGTTSRVYSATATGLYWVVVTDATGCSGASDTATIKVCETGIYVPTGFSPNHDGVNDVFKVIATLDPNSSFTLDVVNRWGVTVFETHDPSKGWDGTFNGETLPADVYIWRIVFQSVGSTGSSSTMKGTVTLVR
jgi:gliding motility-associated-like protein